MNIKSYITEQCAFDPAIAVDMTNLEIANYFSESNFTEMWGEIGDLPFSFDEMIAEAIRLRDAAKA